MGEPVTLEFLSKQLDRVIIELRATRDDIRATREIILRCTAKLDAAHELAQEILFLSDTPE
jgi:hypothetical protein